MKLKEYLEELNQVVSDYPEVLEFEVIYSHDDEGNEFQKVNNTPSFSKVSNIEDNRFLELEDEENLPATNYVKEKFNI